MNILNSITTGNTADGIRLAVAGAEKIGKTTFACSAPNPLLIPLEVGYGSVHIPKTKMIQSYEEFDQLLEELLYWAQQNQFPFKTVIFDSVTALEKLIHQHIVESDKQYFDGNPKGLIIDNVLGGYGRGHAKSNDMFQNVLARCDKLAINHKINIVFTTHVFPSKAIDPIHGEYDTWDLLLHSPKNNKTYGKREIFTQWLDVIGFLYEPIFISGEGESMKRAISANKGRMMGLSRTPSYIAGNRFGLTGEIAIPYQNGWNVLAEALYNSCGLDIYNRG